MKKLNKNDLQGALYGIEAYYETWNGVLQLLGMGLGFALGASLVIIIVTMGRYIGIPLGDFFILVILVPVIYFPIQGMLWARKIIRYFTAKKSKEIIHAGEKIQKLKKISRMSIQNIEEVLSVSKQIYGLLEKVIYLARFKKNEKIQRNLSYLVKEVYDTLDNLQDDLLKELQEKREDLNQANNKLSKLQHTQSGLQKVTEIQKYRLDTQIHQFEALQKILIKY